MELCAFICVASHRSVGKLRTRRVELAGGFHTYVMGAFPYDPFL